tara:strand:+ start:243 stop:1484 length:1242 start_codon:yes stop_codon:yes gene_type:complete
MTNAQKVSGQAQIVWDLKLKTCLNILGINEDTLQKSIDAAPPLHETKRWQDTFGDNAVYLGRFIIPDEYVLYNEEEQPRNKSNEDQHVQELINSYEQQGYRSQSQPPIAVPAEQLVNPNHVRGLSGFHRLAARQSIGQQSYIIDLYHFSSPKWERVARNWTNHHLDPKLNQTWRDYEKEVTNAIEANIIEKDAASIKEFVNLIAADFSYTKRKRICEACNDAHQVHPNFRAFASRKGDGPKTLQGYLKGLNFPLMGFQGRTDNNGEAMKEQGYLLYSADCGDVLRGWASGLYHATLWDIPVWLFGYSPNRVDDIIKYREDFIEDFVDYKEMLIKWAFKVSGSDVTDVEEMLELVDHSTFDVKLGGFYPQYVKPDPKHGGNPTEVGIVDVYGNTLYSDASQFDPSADCLTLTQP